MFFICLEVYTCNYAALTIQARMHIGRAVRDIADPLNATPTWITLVSATSTVFRVGIQVNTNSFTLGHMINADAVAVITELVFAASTVAVVSIDTAAPEIYTDISTGGESESFTRIAWAADAIDTGLAV